MENDSAIPKHSNTKTYHNNNNNNNTNLNHERLNNIGYKGLHAMGYIYVAYNYAKMSFYFDTQC